jgi:glycosyltransferase involved in cell wall biosynthesis
MDISVVIPLYNKVAYIARALDSVLAQSVPASEIVVVDDGSTDGSADVVTSCADSRIRLVRQENQGECAARNRGIAEAQKDLIAFLDADDEWKTDFLFHIRRVCREFPDCGAYATSFEVIHRGGKTEWPTLPQVPSPPWIGILPNYFKAVLHTAPFCSSSICVRRCSFETVGLFPVGVRRGGDRVMWTKLAAYYPIGYSPSRQAVYRADAENRTCNACPIPAAPPVAVLIQDLVESRRLAPDLVADAVEVRAMELMNKATELLKIGQSELAREYLAGYSTRSTILRWKRLQLRALSGMPPWLRSWVLRRGRLGKR